MFDRPFVYYDSLISYIEKHQKIKDGQFGLRVNKSSQVWFMYRSSMLLVSFKYAFNKLEVGFK